MVKDKFSLFCTYHTMGYTDAARSNFKTKVKCEQLSVINFKFYVCQYKTISCSDIIINYWPF